MPLSFGKHLARSSEHDQGRPPEERLPGFRRPRGPATPVKAVGDFPTSQISSPRYVLVQPQRP